MKSTRITALVITVLSLLFFVKEESLFACIFLAANISVLAVCLMTVRLTGKKIELNVSTVENVSKGMSVPLHIKLNNKSKLPIFCMKCSVVCENVLTGEKSREEIFLNAGPLKTSVKTMELDEHNCGYINISVENVRIFDMFMIFVSKTSVTTKGGAYVMPQIRQIELDERVLHAYNMESYQYSTYQKGNDPSETFGIREYIEGDSPKTIHWKLTGKTGELVVRELGLPVENSILLLMDKRLSVGEELGAELRASAAELFLSLSHALLENGIGHSVAWMDYRKGMFIMKHVANQQELWAISGNLLEGPYQEDKFSTPVHYLENEGNRNFASYFYITAGVDSDEMRLEDRGAVKVYRAENFK
jgi:uncharacterized protein (DUF58 family)